MKRFGILSVLCLAVWSFALAPAIAAQDIKPFVRGSYQQIISARQGKPFIVNFWSLTCNYCVVELAMLKKLIKKYPKLDLVLVSTDTQEEEKDISANLAKFSLGKAEAWVFADSFTERLRFEVDKKWQGELPRTYFYSANVGARRAMPVQAISGKLEYKEVEQWVKQQYAIQ
ncbi:MAG: TlpA disulfide reductase family protein [Gallionella sp.]|nr:TlpA disulfide reductase family protein [Gallionella sp.]